MDERPRPTARLASDSDVVNLVRLINDAYSDEATRLYRIPRISEPEVSALLRRCEFIVLDEGGVLIGGLHVAIRGRGCELSTVAVDPERRGRGFGTHLLDIGEAWGRERGCHFAEVAILNHRMDLVPFYRARGYSPSGTRPFPRPEAMKLPCHFVVLSKPLSPGATLLEGACPKP